MEEDDDVDDDVVGGTAGEEKGGGVGPSPAPQGPKERFCSLVVMQAHGLH